MANEIVHHALVSCDMEHKHVVGPLYYIKLCDRSPGPYKTQLHRKAIIDVADDGTLAGVELIDDMPPPPPLKEPASPWRDIESALIPRTPDRVKCKQNKNIDTKTGCDMVPALDHEQGAMNHEQ